MADARQPLRIGEMQEDREALEHIARMLEGRVLRGPGLEGGPTSPSPEEAADCELGLDSAGVKQLLEAMPAAIALIGKGRIVHANAAFAYAFGYRSLGELLDAGGLEAVVPGAVGLFSEQHANGCGLVVEALTRSRRRVTARFTKIALGAESGLELLRLIDPAELETHASRRSDSDLESETGQVAAGPEPTVDPAKARRLDFLAKVSHEVRTPLNSILGFAELMVEERFGPIGNQRYKGYLEDIRQSGFYALSLLNDLLDISKIEAGKFELDFTAVDIAELVEDCVASLQPVARRERILLRTSLVAELPGVLGDRKRLKQILLNLLSNAIKFTSQGGQVILSGTLVEDDSLRLRVRDTGVGMSAAEIEFAMQPFHQLDTAPRNQSGTGLGLPLTKALVDAHKARLTILSEKGEGTSADVVFPRERLIFSIA